MKKKNNQIKLTKIIVISVLCSVLILVSAYFIFFNHPRNFNGFHSKDGRMGNSPITPEIENEITSFFESSPSDQEIENYCSENPQYCGYHCMNDEADFCENFKFQGMPPNETREFNYSG